MNRPGRRKIESVLLPSLEATAKVEAMVQAAGVSLCTVERYVFAILWQNFCLPFLYYFNILFLLIEKSRIPLIENYRT